MRRERCRARSSWIWPAAPRAQGRQRQAIAGIGEEDVRQGIHERNPGHPKLPIQGGGNIKVFTKGEAEVDGAEFRGPGDEIAQRQEGDGPAGPQVQGGQQQVGAQEDEDIGPQGDGAAQ